MQTIGREELKAKLDQGDDFKLVMTMGEWAFNAQHIPGSLNVSRPEDAVGLVQLDDEIVVYCSGPACNASLAAYHALKRGGYTNVYRFVGGLLDWQEAKYALEGDDYATKSSN